MSMAVSNGVQSDVRDLGLASKGKTRIEWAEASWVSDVDPGFYVACYLRAWALETHWRRALRNRFGDRWFASAEAGEWLRGLWSHGQRFDADELLAEELGETLDFGVMVEDLDH